MSNNQKMREALELFVKAYGSERCIHTPLLARAFAFANAALAEPPRNCDVGDEQEQSKRFAEFCLSHSECGRRCGDCPLVRHSCCEFSWSQMPYEAEGGAK